ncbi:MAG: hypothetical protein IAG13_18755 [Deltaproteobacteria bacterium]|nr:hypothetical protein [Nannocystaceae bacterium]
MQLDIDTSQHRPMRARSNLPRNVAKGAGWLALGLGIAHLAVPGAIARMLGVRPRSRARTIVRMLGAGVLVGSVLALGGTYGAQAMSTPRGGRTITRAITIARRPTDVHAFLLASLSGPTSLMRYGAESFEAVEEPSGARVSAGLEDVFDDTPTLEWRMSPDAGFEGEASVEVRVAPGDRGTEVIVRLHYDAPDLAGVRAVRKLFGKDPSVQLGRGLARIKQTLETGAVARSDASIHRGMHAAQPTSIAEEART